MPVEPLVELVDFGPLLAAAGLASSPPAIATRFEWSVMAMYFSPRCLAAATISSMLACAVGPRAVHVQVAADVAQLDQRGQLAGVGPLELPPGLAQLGRKTGQVQGRVDVLFRAAGDLLSRRGRRRIR